VQFFFLMLSDELGWIWIAEGHGRVHSFCNRASINKKSKRLRPKLDETGRQHLSMRTGFAKNLEGMR